MKHLDQYSYSNAQCCCIVQIVTVMTVLISVAIIVHIYSQLYVRSSEHTYVL